MKQKVKASTTVFPRKRIHDEITSVMPKGKKFELRIAESGIRKMKIVRVVTDAWKTRPHSDRIGKIIEAVGPKLTPAENRRILRFSVLTPMEYDEFVLGKVVSPAPAKKRRAPVTIS